MNIIEKIRKAMKEYWIEGRVERMEEVASEIWMGKRKECEMVKEMGDKKYGYENWREGEWGEKEKRGYVNAIMRHSKKWMRGGKDKESGIDHMGHIGISMWIIIEQERTGGGQKKNNKDTNKEDMISKLGWEV
jgi:hypothetical protein